MQSFEWGQFQENFGKAELSSGRKVFRFAKDNWQAQFIEMPLPAGKKYLHCPRGPVMARDLKGQEFKDAIQNLAEETSKAVDKNTIFFRIGPEWQISQGIENILYGFGFQKLPYDVEPSQSLILDISKTEEELLAQMHEKWRYNIRLAERKNVKVKMITSADEEFEKYFEEFYKLTDQGTAARKHIKHHAKEYYKKQLQINPEQPSFKKDGQVYKREVNEVETALFVAEAKKKVIAANIVVFFGNRATYLHGATDNEFRNLMAPHLLQWEQIKEAKKRGCTEYDFWGIVNEHTTDKRGPSWEGFTRFKKGFGGREENYIGYFDFALDKNWYSIYRLIQKFRR